MVEEERRRFEALMLPHMDAAYNFARWLVRDEADARDAMQDAYLRAFRFFGRFRGTDAKPWLLAIVRNSCRDLTARNRRHLAVPLPEEGHSDDPDRAHVESPFRLDGDPEKDLIEKDRARVLNQLVKALPVEFREVIMLREFEDLSYKEIAEIVEIPIGTVMSRLARARSMLRESWNVQVAEEVGHDMR